jgi:hypothetical protein
MVTSYGRGGPETWSREWPKHKTKRAFPTMKAEVGGRLKNRG